MDSIEWRQKQQNKTNKLKTPQRFALIVVIYIFAYRIHIVIDKIEKISIDTNCKYY